MPDTNATPDVKEVLTLLAAKGNIAYFGEDVSVLEHSLQSAHFAERDHADDATITAALVHDIGHLLHGLSEDIAAQGHDARHEEVACTYLARYFDENVIAPVRMHVAAKRYLCSVEPTYLTQLSPSSVQSLALQGGPFTPSEAADFASRPYAQKAVALRRWDDEAKLQNYPTPTLDHYLPHLQAAQKPAS
jgi:phosphonate degradation associated HDIG domain protein